MDYVIENDLLKVTLTDRGGQIKSVVHKSDGAEHIWCGDEAVWKFQSPVLFPYTGRVKDGRIDIRGQKVENAPQHGVVRLMEHRPTEQGREALTLVAEENEQSMAIFPYRFRFYATFRLEGQKLHHTLTVENTDSEAFSFGIGFHPGFAVPFDDRHRIEDYSLRFSELESPICMETPDGLLNGKYSRPSKNIRSIPIREGIFDEGSRCMVGLRSRTLGLYENDSGRAVVCHIENFPYCLIWGNPGKPRFVCIEPWHSLPSHVEDGYAWERKSAAATVEAGQRWSTTLTMEFLR